LFVGWLWYLVMLLPVIGIVEVGLQGHANRYTYLPQIGLYLMITSGAYDFVRSLNWGLSVERWTLNVCSCGIVVALAFTAHKQTTYWRNSETLWTHTLAVTKDNDVAQTNFGMFLMD